MLIDNLLAKYGDESREARATLRRAIPIVEGRIWKEGQSTTLQSAPFKTVAEGEALYQQVQQPQPNNNLQRALQARIVELANDLMQARFLLFSHLNSSIPLPFLVVLLLWMVILFAGFALIAPPNATTLVCLIVCALSVSGAIFLILELDEPFSGIMVIRSEPLLNAVPPLGRNSQRGKEPRLPPAPSVGYEETRLGNN